jgi:hypothetical protein
MRVLSQLAGAALGLFVVNGCSSTDPGGQSVAGGGDAGTAGASGASAGSNAGGGGSPGGTGGLGGSAPAGASGLAGGSHAGTGGLGGAGTAGSGTAGGGGAGGHRFSIRFDYRFDTVGFFTPDRRAALEAAGALWSNLIRDDFEAVPKGTGIRTKNPENRDEYLWVESIEADIDDLLVFVGTSEAIPGLGRGGPSGGIETTDSTLAAALTARREGADFEPWAGSITFKASSNFFFDATPATSNDIPPASYDFISLAAHELGHVLGFSNCAAFDAFISDTSFIGPAARANYGAAVPLVSDFGHFLEDLQSGGMDTLMDPGLSNGVRVVPTQLDRAVFTDLGYEIAN